MLGAQKDILQILAVSVLLPGFLFSMIPGRNVQPVITHPPTTVPSATAVTQPQQTAQVIPVVQKDGTITRMDLEEYVCAVVLGEMPASFETEALKAQAVAARTYALRCSLDGVHPQNAVCMDHKCCQNYCDPALYLNAGGKQSNLDKIKSAVSATRGEILYYQNKPIFAAYFASSGGQTEDAVAVWGKSFPYLVSVESAAEQDKDYQNCKVSFTHKTFQQKLGVTLSGKPESWIGKITYTNGGGVEKIVIGGKSYTGVKLRSLLGLRSTKFTVKVTSTAVIFVTDGYGHRVGMSQYGADAMAAAGKSYRQILSHYYTGTIISEIQK